VRRDGTPRARTCAIGRLRNADGERRRPLGRRPRHWRAAIEPKQEKGRRNVDGGCFQPCDLAVFWPSYGSLTDRSSIHRSVPRSLPSCSAPASAFSRAAAAHPSAFWSILGPGYFQPASSGVSGRNWLFARSSIGDEPITSCYGASIRTHGTSVRAPASTGLVHQALGLIN
jgi:hypothetical protein